MINAMSGSSLNVGYGRGYFCVCVSRLLAPTQPAQPEVQSAPQSALWSLGFWLAAPSCTPVSSRSHSSCKLMPLLASSCLLLSAPASSYLAPSLASPTCLSYIFLEAYYQHERPASTNPAATRTSGFLRGIVMRLMKIVEASRSPLLSSQSRILSQPASQRELAIIGLLV